jgi:hypothetical protein
MAATRTGGLLAGVVCAWFLAGCCHKCGQTVCVEMPETKTVTKTVYDENCKTICTPPGPCEAVAHCLGHGCEGGDCGVCGRPRAVHRLVKKSEKEERCVTKCQPVTHCIVATLEAPAPASEAKTDLPRAVSPIIAAPK